MAHDLFAYAGQVTTGSRDAYRPLDLGARSDASPSQLLEVAETSAAQPVFALDSASPDARAWHVGLNLRV